jgi:hypothetical protein
MKRGGEITIALVLAALNGVWGGLLADRVGVPDPAWLLVLLLLIGAAFLIGRATR